MSSRPLEEAVDRVERALLRVERAVERETMSQGGAGDQERDEALRARVAQALGELDEIIRDAGNG